MKDHYRVGGKQPRNIYRVTDEHPDGEYIGVFFDERDAYVAVVALNTRIAYLADIADQVVSHD